MSQNDDEGAPKPPGGTAYSPNKTLPTTSGMEHAHQPVLQSWRHRIEAKARKRAEDAENGWKAAVVEGVQLEGQLQTAKATRELATDRLKNISEEATWHREQVRAGLQETINRADTAKAEADEIITTHRARQAQSRAATAEADAAATIALATQLEAELEVQRLRAKLAGAAADTEGKGARLKTMEIELRAELLAIDDRLAALLMDDTEGSAQKRHYHEAERISVKERLAKVVHKLAELDDLL